MPQRFIDDCTPLTDDEAGGHGDRWAVFADDIGDFLGTWLALALRESEPMTWARPEPPEAGTLPAAGLLFTNSWPGHRRSGALIVIDTTKVDPDGQTRAALASLYLHFDDGVEVMAAIDALERFPNCIEARLGLALNNGPYLTAFDTLFWAHGPGYRRDTTSRFALAGMSYRFGPAEDRSFTIDDPEQIRRHHARMAWALAHGHWQVADEGAALAAWQPSGPEDLEPIHIDMSQAACLSPMDMRRADEYTFQGEVIRRKRNALRFMGISFWRIDLAVTRALGPEDADLVLPIYVSPAQFPDHWEPEVGKYVSGSMWLQAHALVGQEGSEHPFAPDR